MNIGEHYSMQKKYKKILIYLTDVLGNEICFIERIILLKNLVYHLKNT